MPYDYEAIAAMFMSRVADQAQTLAVMIDAARDTDARMVVRSMLEHVILVSWMSIDLDELEADARDAGKWTATEPDANARWWSADQLRRDKRRIEAQITVFGLMPAPEVREAMKVIDKPVKDAYRGNLPNLETQAREADRAWGGRLLGWPSEAANTEAGRSGLHAMYHSVYQLGSSSVHPDLSELQSYLAITELPGQASLRPVAAHELRVDSAASIAAFVLVYGTAVVQHRLGWPDHDETLRVLGRFDVVRGPGLMLDLARQIANGSRVYATATDGGLISVQADSKRVRVVLVGRAGWIALRRHPRGWELARSGEKTITAKPRDVEGPVSDAIARMRAEMKDASGWTTARPDRWPATVP